jgi:hypothetical protein
VGLLLVVLPWSGFWERNYFASMWPPLRVWLSNDFVRGAISGLGVLNLFAGFFELAPILFLRAHHPIVLDTSGYRRHPHPDTRAEP